MFDMRRREFIALLGGAAAVWPVAARAQQDERVRRIGVLMGLSESDPEAQSRIAAFRKTLSTGGSPNRTAMSKASATRSPTWSRLINSSIADDCLAVDDARPAA